MPKPQNHSDENVYKWLDEVRERISMHARSIDDLEQQIWGYYVALRTYNVVESVPSLCRHFGQWIGYKTNWCVSSGWAYAIKDHIKDHDQQFAKFFEFLDEYRSLKPTLVSYVNLKKKHEPTGERVCFGMNKLMDKPKRVDIYRYKPAPLHFLRFHYADYVDDSRLLHNKEAECTTTILDAKRWAKDELQVARDEWRKPHNNGLQRSRA